MFSNFINRKIVFKLSFLTYNCKKFYLNKKTTKQNQIDWIIIEHILFLSENNGIIQISFDNFTSIYSCSFVIHAAMKSNLKIDFHCETNYFHKTRLHRDFYKWVRIRHFKRRIKCFNVWLFICPSVHICLFKFRRECLTYYE